MFFLATFNIVSFLNKKILIKNRYILIMKKIGLVFFSLAILGLFLTFQNCGDKKDDPTPAEKTKELLMSKTWTYSSVVTPEGTATTDDMWQNFSVQFGESTMSTSGHPTGATAVWPGGGYTISEDGTTVTRSADNVQMIINPLTASNMTARFTIPPGTEIGGRIAALGGEYTFNLK